jgi:hypothetical protein
MTVWNVDLVSCRTPPPHATFHASMPNHGCRFPSLAMHLLCLTATSYTPANT